MLQFYHSKLSSVPVCAERLKILRGHHGLVKGVTWDPVGRYLATQADDKTLIVWRTSDWSQETVITKPFQAVSSNVSLCSSDSTSGVE